jgi:biopolymer transport protein ExbD
MANSLIALCVNAPQYVAAANNPQHPPTVKAHDVPYNVVVIRLRRHDLSPRVELLPLIDVVFLLLTFFIYSLIVMRYMPNVLPVKLSPVTAGQAAKPIELQALTIDRAGVVYLNREALPPSEIDARLAELGAIQDTIKLVIAMEELDAAARGEPAAEVEVAVDRGPALMDLIGRVRRAGIENFDLLGDPSPGGG